MGLEELFLGALGVLLGVGGPGLALLGGGHDGGDEVGEASRRLLGLALRRTALLKLVVAEARKALHHLELWESMLLEAPLPPLLI